MMFRELKARKAKYGFDYGYITLAGVISLAQFLEEFQSVFSKDQYIMEETGYNRPELKIYTDDNNVAEWIRNYNR